MSRFTICTPSTLVSALDRNRRRTGLDDEVDLRPGRRALPAGQRLPAPRQLRAAGAIVCTALMAGTADSRSSRSTPVSNR